MFLHFKKMSALITLKMVRRRKRTVYGTLEKWTVIYHHIIIVTKEEGQLYGILNELFL